MYTVYKLTNKVTGKCYIGCTSNLESRLDAHFRFDPTGHSSAISKIADKYPRSDWEVHIIKSDITSRSEALDLESEQIIINDSINNGYNSCIRQGFGGSVDPRAAVAVAWSNGSLLEERKTRFKDPEKYYKHCQIQSSEKMREIRSRAMKDFMTNPDKRESLDRMRANIKASLNTPESKIKRSKINEKYDEVLVSRIKSIAAKFKRSNAAIGRAFNIPRPTVNDMVSGRSYTKCQIDDSKLHLVSFSKGEVVISDIKDFYEGC